MSSGTRPRRAHRRVCAPRVLLTCLVWVQRGARELLRFDNVRLLLADHAPLLGRGVRVASKLGHAAPPAVSPSGKPQAV
ncbi:MAG: hypothetical protein U0174_17520 [Polyangiaceae bacterium]